MKSETMWLLGGGALLGFVAVAAAGSAAPAKGNPTGPSPILVPWRVAPPSAPKPPPVGTEPPYPPIKGAWPLRLSSRYGYRTDPVYGGKRLHAGIDLPVPVGTPVYAPLPGVVVRVDRVGDGDREANGNAVILAVAGYRWCFLHLSAPLVKVGQTVARGQQIALSGNTGKSTGPHLHVQVYDREGNTIDPERLYPDGMFVPRSA